MAVLVPKTKNYIWRGKIGSFMIFFFTEIRMDQKILIDLHFWQSPKNGEFSNLLLETMFFLTTQKRDTFDIILVITFEDVALNVIFTQP